MKISLFDRIVLLIFTIIGLFIGVGLILIAIGFWGLNDVSLVFSSIQTDSLTRLLTIIAAAVFVLLCLRLLVLPQGRMQSEQDILLNVSEHGSVRISLFTLDSLAQKHIRSSSFVRDVKVQVVLLKDQIKIRAKLSLMPETDIPRITAQLQASTKEYVEKYSGVHVQEIQFFVEDTSLNLKARVD
ncbi:MAG: alkaline shock response membrane anchor protein AmaP [Christensenellales bacterium]|jgi:uncharacterized alkaline shock family protein YloU